MDFLNGLILNWISFLFSHIAYTLPVYIMVSFLKAAFETLFLLLSSCIFGIERVFLLTEERETSGSHPLVKPLSVCLLCHCNSKKFETTVAETGCKSF